MRKICILLFVCILASSPLALAGKDQLIRLDQIDPVTVDQIKAAGIAVYGKTASFWIAGASEEDLEFLAERRIPFQVLDQEAMIGQHYVVLSKPGEEIQSYLPEIKAKSRILMTEQDMALVKGDPGEIEKLALAGLELRRIRRNPLPLEPKTYLTSYLQSLSPEYDPLIDSMINRVGQAQLLTLVNDLSGEDTVMIGGVEDSIKTRYSWSSGITKAADYLKEGLQGFDMSVEYDTFQVAFQTQLMDIDCSPDGQKACCINMWGDILITDDGGNHWNFAGDDPYMGLEDIFRFDDDNFWVVGAGGIILKTSDGGLSWELRSSPDYDTVRFKGCHFHSPDLGWVAGWGMILFTVNGGANWIQQLTVPNMQFSAVDFVDRYRGWAVGEGGMIYHTDNGGFEWMAQSSGLNTFIHDVDFLDSLNGWVVGEMGWALYTTDGGATWNDKYLVTSDYLRKVTFVDSLHGWILAYGGDVFYTSDRGLNWVCYPTDIYALRGIGFADTSTGWACGPSGIIKTTDGGQNWFYQFESVGPRELCNVVATIEGAGYPGRQFLMTAHYDATSQNPYIWTPGADDNASGAVAVFSAASILRDYHFVNTIKFVSFSGEEQGLLGSMAYAEEASERGDTILGVLNLDMIAYDGNEDRVMEVHCGLPPENQALGDILIGAMSDYALNLVPEKLVEGASWRSDHASFWEYNFPAIGASEDHQDFNPHYHTTDDRIVAFDTSYYLDFVKAATATIAILGDPFILGDANGDLIIDPSDVVHLINYFFKNGPAPDPLIAGDCNCDGIVGPGDVVHLINYLFRDGPPPSCM
jgi:photosystem II stability/assembly factor-like uncharacterized protein